MTLINLKELNPTRLGTYKQDDVENLISEANEKHEAALKRLAKFEAQRDLISNAMQAAEESKAETLNKAHLEANHIVNEAESKASAIMSEVLAEREEANSKYSDIIDNAKDQAQAIRTSAEYEADKILDEASKEAYDLVNMAKAKHDEILSSAVESAKEISDEITKQTTIARNTQVGLRKMRNKLDELLNNDEWIDTIEGRFSAEEFDLDALAETDAKTKSKDDSAAKQAKDKSQTENAESALAKANDASAKIKVEADAKRKQIEDEKRARIAEISKEASEKQAQALARAATKHTEKPEAKVVDLDAALEEINNI